jgi:uncharacterized coiled-coil protein SlyX
MCKNNGARLFTVLIGIHELRIDIYNRAIASLRKPRMGLYHLFRCMINESEHNITELKQLAAVKSHNVEAGSKTLRRLIHTMQDQSLCELLGNRQISLPDFEERIVMHAYEQALQDDLDSDLAQAISEQYEELKISSNLIRGCLQPQLVAH